MYNTITEQANTAIRELLAAANLKAGDLLVVGCSSSEIAGGTIGHDSSVRCAKAAYAGIAPVTAEAGVTIALNDAILSQLCDSIISPMVKWYIREHILSSQGYAGSPHDSCCQYSRY